MPVKTNVKFQTYFKRFNKSSESNAEVHCFLFSFTDLIKSFEYLPNQIAYFNPLKIEIQSRILRMYLDIFYVAVGYK